MGAELIMCPWCRQSPEHSYSNANPGRETLYVIRCTERSCPVRPSITDRSRESVTERWNRRTPPQAAQGDDLAHRVIVLMSAMRTVESCSTQKEGKKGPWSVAHHAMCIMLRALHEWPQPAPPRAEVSEELVEVACRAYYKSIGMNPDDLRRVNTTYEGPVDGQIDMGNYYERGVFKWREKVKVMRDVLTAAMNGGE